MLCWRLKISLLLFLCLLFRLLALLIGKALSSNLISFDTISFHFSFFTKFCKLWEFVWWSPQIIIVNLIKHFLLIVLHQSLNWHFLKDWYVNDQTVVTILYLQSNFSIEFSYSEKTKLILFSIEVHNNYLCTTNTLAKTSWVFITTVIWKIWMKKGLLERYYVHLCTA